MGLEYRVVKRDTADGRQWHELRVVETDHNGRVLSIKETPVCPGGEFLSDLLTDLQMMLEAFKEQIVEVGGILTTGR